MAALLGLTRGEISKLLLSGLPGIVIGTMYTSSNMQKLDDRLEDKMQKLEDRLEDKFQKSMDAMEFRLKAEVNQDAKKCQEDCAAARAHMAQFR